ncbi:CHAT domain-containing protein [Kutzneria sp. NPDC052558]|uniref:CHAT domain-containing protein n=1 Tax=Kutzneria sp. NPDC052558 TaxID=3364121 RepID=UPI0037C95B9D
MTSWFASPLDVDLERAMELVRRADPAAPKAVKKLLRNATKQRHLGHQTTAHLLSAQIEERRSNWPEAHRQALLAVELLEQRRLRTLTADLRMETDLSYACEAAVFPLLTVRGMPDRPIARALEIIERSRSRVLLELLGADAPAPQGLEGLVKRERDLMREAVASAADVTPDRVPFTHQHSNAWWARDELNRAWRDIAATGPAGAAYVAMRRGDPAGYDEIRAILGSLGERTGRRVLLVEFLVHGPGVFVLLARQDYPEPIAVPVRRAPAPNRFRTVEAARAVDPAGWDAPYRPLLAPIADHCDPGDVVWLVPDADLHDVPLPAVTVGGTALCERNPVCSTPSATIMRYCVAGPVTRAARLLVLADSRTDRPLPHARAEALAISAAFPAATTHLGAEVTREHTRSLLTGGEYDIVHIACHSRFNSEDPLRSGVLLADGELTVADVLSMRLSARLVTLSGCETGAAQLRTGNELIGFTRALLRSGARSVLVSRWPVEDVAAGLLMSELYQAVADGRPTAVALSAGQARLRSVTVAEVISHCQEVARTTSGPRAQRDWRLDVAALRVKAFDFAAAAEEYDRLADGSSDAAELRGLATRCRLAAAAGRAVDYTVRPFDHPYHWASFSLVGDWR